MMKGVRAKAAVAASLVGGLLVVSGGVAGPAVAGAQAPIDFAHGVAVQPNGRIVVVGSTDVGNDNRRNEDFAVARYLADGSLDRSFSGDGLQRIDFSKRGDGTDDSASQVAIQANGKIMVAGSVEPSDDLGLVRLRADGRLDARFSEDGIKTVKAGAPSALLTQGGGKTVVAVNGSAHDGFVYPTELVCLTRRGRLDKQFSKDGRQWFASFGGRGISINALLPRSDGRILAAGGAVPYRASGFGLFQAKQNGMRDGSLGERGRRFVKLSDDDGESTTGALGLFPKPDGGFVVAGAGPRGYNEETGADQTVAIAHFTARNRLDTSFSGDGVAISTPISDDNIPAIVQQPDGQLVVASSDFSMTKLNTDGSVDSQSEAAAFGGADDLTLLPNGSVVLVGFEDSPGTQHDFALASFSPDGSLNSAFSGDGLVTTDFGPTRGRSGSVPSPG